jgi:hypothetical protein
MTPSHANKKGIRYRYYVSQAILQNRESEAGSVTRVSAPDVEDLVVKAIREKVAEDEAANATGQMLSGNQGKSETANKTELLDRDLLLKYAAKIIVCKDRLLLNLRADPNDLSKDKRAALNDQNDHEDLELATCASTNEGPDKHQLSIPFKPNQPLCKGIVADCGTAPTTIDANTRKMLLLTIAKSRGWMEGVLHGSKLSFAAIAAEEQISERYVRRLAQLAFLSPKIIEAIDIGTAPAGLTVSRLTQSLPMAWAQQERMIGLG